MFTNREYADMVFVYGVADGNALLARDIYHDRFPQRRIPNARTFQNTFVRLGEIGNFNFREPAAPAGQRHHAQVDDMILARFDADPTISVRKIARELHLSTWKVWSVVHSDGRHPFHYTPVQELEEGDPPRRIIFCRYLINTDAEDDMFLKRILWTDESKFDKNGITNFHNLHYWEHKGNNPHMKKQVSSQRRFSVNVWAGVIGGTFIGPHYLPNNLNGEHYLHFLQNNLFDLLEDVPINNLRNMIFQNDGCPAHYARAVRDHLDRVFPNRWIGRNGPVLWPARSPDLTPLDFHVWGRLKDLVYNEEIQNVEHLTRKINEACQIFKNEMRLRVTTTEVRRRARLCIRNGGRHIEHL